MREMSRVVSRGAVSGDSSVETTASSLLSAAEARIESSRNIEHWQPGLARWDAEVLLGSLLGLSPDDRRLGDALVSTSQRRAFARLVDRRVTGEPVNYITGFFMFCGLRLEVRRGVFSPRSSSELTADHAARRLRRFRGRRVGVDVATGSGAIALAVGAHVPRGESWGVDISRDAVVLGRHNARRLGLGNVRFLVSDMLDNLPATLRGEVGVFTIHPPYIARHELRTLPVEIRKFEPHSTLSDGSDDGLGLVRRLADDAPGWLRPGGWVMVEIAPYLARSTGTILRRAGFREVRSHRDTLGVTRVVAGRQ
jgi:release factor glutamine methyltransferase